MAVANTTTIDETTRFQVVLFCRWRWPALRSVARDWTSKNRKRRVASRQFRPLRQAIRSPKTPTPKPKRRFERTSEILPMTVAVKIR